MFLIEKGFAEQFSGSTRMQFKRRGVVCEIDVPLAEFNNRFSARTVAGVDLERTVQIETVLAIHVGR